MKNEALVWILGIFVVIILFAGIAFGIPMYRVWVKGKTGQANLRQAEQEKLILIEQAKAEVEAAKLRAEAISVVGAAAQKYPEYRYQEFLMAFGNAMESDSIQKIILVPTEANVPLVQTMDIDK